MSSESRCNRVGSKHIDVPVNAFTLFAATGPSLRQFLVDIMPWSRDNEAQMVDEHHRFGRYVASSRVRFA
jgi:hypothetical protein